MAYDPTDALNARALLEDALAITAEPTLTTEQVDRAFALASSLDDDGEVVYLPADLDKAAAWGWDIKAGLATAEYQKLGGGPGISLERPELVADCERRAALFRSHRLSVVPGATSGGSGIGSIGIVGTAAVNYPW